MSTTGSRVRAPEFPAGKSWFNVSEPLTLERLWGKVVLLDFWTYCCINCLHVLADLKRLEQKHAADLVVIGVHCAKFPTERRDDSLRQAIQRYEVEHPVVSDSNFEIWGLYAVRAWPTQVLVDPEGYLIGQAAGEGNYELLDKAVHRLCEIHRSRGALSPETLDLGLRSPAAESGFLKFPGKVLADGASGRLFVSDTNHHRILVCDFDGRVQTAIGSGTAGDLDGPFSRCSFSRPQGLAVSGKHLFVADTQNHLVRYCNLEKGLVATVGGTGEKTTDFGIWGMQDALTTPLNSPWDLHLSGENLFIAMAGPHQIWVLNTAGEEIGPYAGSGHEDCSDGSRPLCSMAQPSGLTGDSQNLYVADAETSSLRMVPLSRRGEVRTLVGQGLFDFGDEDGKGSAVRLQHPMDVEFAGDKLYIADSYNHKIKTLDLATQKVRTLFGTGEPGLEDGPTGRFSEPGGISLAGQLLFVADTNNHAVRKLDLSNGNVSTLNLSWSR